MNQGNTSTLFQFDNAQKLISNPESLLESAEFHTEEKRRHAQMSIIKRNTGLKNKRIHLKVVLSGSSKVTNANTLISTLSDNEFIYLDTESHQTRLDGVYAPNGGFTQKLNNRLGTIILDFDLIEKET